MSVTHTVDMAAFQAGLSSLLQLYNNDGKMVLAIKSDGTIERGSAFTTEDEASLRLWDAIAQTWLSQRERA